MTQEAYDSNKDSSNNNNNDNDNATTPIVRFFDIDDSNTILREAGVKYVGINEPMLLVGHNHKDSNTPIELELTEDVEDLKEKLSEKSKTYLSEEATKELLDYVSEKIYLDNSDIVAKIIDNKKKKEKGVATPVTAVKALKFAKANSKELFVDEFGRAYAVIIVKDHTEILSMEEGRFKKWLVRLFFTESKGKILNDEDVKKVVQLLEAQAEFDSNIKRHRLDLRVRGHNNTEKDDDYKHNEEIENFNEIYYDLTNNNWEVVKITPEGWSIVKDPPILFKRHEGVKPQVYPSNSGDYPSDILDQLISLFNIKNDLHKFLLKVHIVIQFWTNTTQKALLILHGSQGSAKSTLFEILRDFVDPNVVGSTSLPPEIFNLKQYLSHNYVSFFDNVSHINGEQSDCLCRAVTGAGDSKRKLYKDDSDIIYSYRRIVGLNGITNAATRPDLLDRALIIELETIQKSERELLRVIERNYKKIKAQCLAFCFDVISEVLKERQKWKGVDDDYFGMRDLIQKHGGLPRLPDYVLLGEQIASAIARKEGKEYEPGSLLKAWDENQNTLNVEALKASLVAEALITFMTDREEVSHKTEPWEGSASQLLTTLNNFIREHQDIGIDLKSKSWPHDPARLGSQLSRIKSNLTPLGIIVESKRTKKNILYKISKSPTPIYNLHQEPNSSLNEHENGVGASNVSVGVPTSAPTPIPTPNKDEDQARITSDIDGGVGVVGTFDKKSGDMEVSDTLDKAIDKAMLDSQGNSKGYFTIQDFVFSLVMLPNEGWTVDQAEQTFYALVDEGRIEKIEGAEEEGYRRSIEGEEATTGAALRAAPDNNNGNRSSDNNKLAIAN